jgi:DNA-binding beta-propeller fold protein YncE
MVNVSLRRRALLAAGGSLALGLAGCAAVDDAPAASAQPPLNDPSRILTPWLSIAGAWRVDAQAPVPGVRPGALPGALPGPLPGVMPTGGRANFVQPTGVAARNDVVLVADAGNRTLWRLERGRDAMAPFASFSGSVPDVGTSLVLGNDYSAWVALPAEHVVLQYDPRGRVVRRFGSESDAPRPVAVVVPENRGEILVGDSATSRVLVFDPLGTLRARLGGRRESPLQSLTAMALGPNGLLYVLDRAAQQVVVMDREGRPLEVIGENQLVQPRALAVDATGRVFVSDDVDQRIKVFRGARLLATAGGIGGGLGRFGRIESLSLDGNLLYVADSVNGRVQVMMVAPASMETGGPAR